MFLVFLSLILYSSFIIFNFFFTYYLVIYILSPLHDKGVKYLDAGEIEVKSLVFQGTVNCIISSMLIVISLFISISTIIPIMVFVISFYIRYRKSKLQDSRVAYHKQFEPNYDGPSLRHSDMDYKYNWLGAFAVILCVIELYNFGCSKGILFPDTYTYRCF